MAVVFSAYSIAHGAGFSDFTAKAVIAVTGDVALQLDQHKFAEASFSVAHSSNPAVRQRRHSQRFAQ
jgi:hypothetical protein